MYAHNAKNEVNLIQDINAMVHKHHSFPIVQLPEPRVHVIRSGIAWRILERTEFDQTCAKTLVKQSGILYT